MLALKGYFNGKEFIPLDKVEARPNQKVIITILDEYISTDNEIVSEETKNKLNAIDKLNALLRDEEPKVIKEFDEEISKRFNFARGVELLWKYTHLIRI